MITYPDGAEVRVGDNLLLNHGRQTGVVLQVIESLEQAELQGLDEPGLLIEWEGLGSVFQGSKWTMDEDEIRFVSRASAQA